MEMEVFQTNQTGWRSPGGPRTRWRNFISCQVNNVFVSSRRNWRGEEDGWMDTTEVSMWKKDVAGGTIYLFIYLYREIKVRTVYINSHSCKCSI